MYIQFDLKLTTSAIFPRAREAAARVDDRPAGANVSVDCFGAGFFFVGAFFVV